MRILADENVAGDVVAALRHSGHDVAWILTEAPSSRDRDILIRATAEDRVLVTADKDFGELAFRSDMQAPSGVVLLRVRGSSSSRVAQIVAAAIESRDDWSGHFSVVENHRVRMTPLP